MEQTFTKKQTYPQFLGYILPSIITMIFLSFYTTIDGFFVSRYVSADALAAINIVIPISCVLFGIAVMLATGSGALVSIRLGEQDKEGANGFFSFITLVLVVIGIVITLVGTVYIRPILGFLGATERIMPHAVKYGLVTILMALPMMFKLYLEYYARVDGSPKVSLIMSTVGLVLNVILDFVFIYVCGMDILGAALGTFLSITVSACIGLVYFLSSKSMLRFTKPTINFKELWHASYNGSCEMFTEFSTGITTSLFNIAILHFYGEAGVASMSIIMYIYYFFIATYFGVTVGICPMISYNLGAHNKEKMRESIR